MIGMDKAALISVIQDQHAFKLPVKTLERTPLASLEDFQANRYVIVLSGVRRCGKSTLMHQFRLKQAEQDFYLQFEDERLVAFTVADFQLLLETFIELYGVQKTLYFDEIQNIEGWERFVRRVHDQGYKVYLTGSNSNMLSQELGTHLTGRYLSITLYPFSFAEFVQIANPELLVPKNLGTDQIGLLKKAFREYSEVGGFPEYIETGLPDTLHMLYQNILYRDIVTRYRLSNPRPLKELVLFLASNISKEVSFNRVKTLLGLGSATTVSDYCSYLENVYLCFLINRYDPSLSKQTLHPKKCYLIDHALAKIIGFRPSEDRGRLLENLVFLELKRRKKEVYFHKAERECDFLVREGSKITEAIQVCLDCSTPETHSREVAGLLDAMRSYQLKSGLILTEDSSAEWVETEGQTEYIIRMQPVWKWLLQNSDRPDS